MGAKVYIDGAVLEPQDARVSVFDRGFLYGDSIYEVVRTSGGKPVDLEPHLERLERSAAAIALDIPSRAHIAAAVHETLRAAGNNESYVRVICTRGGGEIGLDIALADTPSLLIIVKPLTTPPPVAYEQGIKLRIVSIMRNPRRALDPAVKSGNYLNNIMALAEARRQGADEAVMCDAEGRVTEGSTCNVFIVQRGRLRTPALELGLLAGITRQRVIEMARGAGIEVSEDALTPDDVRGADEVFITSSLRTVVPVSEVDGSPVRAGVGPVTRQLMELYRQHLARVAAAD